MVDSGQRGGGGTKLVPDDDELHRMTGITPEDAAEVERQYYDEQAAGIADAENQRSAQADRVLHDIREAEKGTDRPGYAGPGGGGAAAGSGGAAVAPTDGEKTGDAKDDTKNSLSNKENEAGKKQNSMFRQEGGGKKKPMLSIGKLNLGRKGLFAIGTTIVSLIVGILMSIMATLSPFKIPSITQYLENRFYAATNNAFEETMQRAFTSYLKRVVIPSLGGQCPSTNVNRSCLSDPLESHGNPMINMFRRWAGIEGDKFQRLEYKLAQPPTSLEIYKSGDKFFMRSPSLGNPVPMDDVINGRVANIMDLPQVSSATVRAELMKGMEQAGFFKRMYYRKQIGELLKQKYGFARCWLACDFKDKTYGKYSDLKQAGMAIFIRRVVEPVSLTQAVALQCLMNPCSEVYTSDGINDSDLTNGEPMNEFRRNAKRLRVEYSRKYSSDKFDALVKNMDYYKENGGAAYATKIIIEHIGGGMDPDKKGEIAANIVSQIGTPIQWLLFAFRVLSFMQHAEQLRGFKYEIVAAAGASMFELMRTDTHELRSGHMNAAAHGSFVDLFAYGNTGGGLPAEASPLYDQLFSGSASARPAAAYLRSILPQTAMAQPASAELANANIYRCNDGQTLWQHAQGSGDPLRITCCEERAKACDGWLQVAHFVTNLPVLKQLILVFDSIAGFFQGIIKDLTQEIQAFLAPIMELLLGWIKEYAAPLIKAVLDSLIPAPFGDVVNGSRYFNAGVSGADAGGNYFAHRGLGGKRLTPAETTAILEEETVKEQAHFATLSLRERLFSTENTYSMTSQLAMAMPSNPSDSARTAFATLLTSPAKSITNSMASVFTLSDKAHAQVYTQSYHGISQYGIPKTHPFFAPNVDPVQWWEDNCSGDKYDKVGAAYNTDKATIEEIEDPEMKALVAKYGYTLNPGTQEPENDEPNICFLLKSVSNYDQLPPAPAAAGVAPTPGGGPVSIVGEFAFPLEINKAGIKNNNIFGNGTTQSGHNYLAFDILVNPGTPVVAAMDGTVSHISSDVCGGRLVAIYNQPSDLTISYLHMDDNGIGDNAPVTKGMRIGTVGQMTSGGAGCLIPHLHIDAIQGQTRVACSRSNCPPENAAKFRDIGPQLFTTYQGLAP